ncbi:NAD(P)H-hydrate dehydratase [Chitinophaga silvatica]|uniref:Bifunctional NAD(P)H-hydrate repair enzyme n=1 Tax=Chitinophaga silvatica TaxID=2282649 RepID=A0A3E1Y6G2_9BACT|nr:NAD(P)H-hydrate dehydratase [Chitinophaga silvatica]RFS20542.1 NAD(P)H-hydrate dehydratase [Chitinophaga silvatica]
MKIFSAEQIREADQFTIQHTPISSSDLMERAAGKCVSWYEDHFTPDHPVYIFCGKGNNGGDGLVMARLLQQHGYTVNTFILQHSNNPSKDHTLKLQQLTDHYPSSIHSIGDLSDFPELPANAVIIDAIFGTGMSRPVEGWLAGIIHRINDHRLQHTIVSVDLPSGMIADESSVHFPVIQAHYTLSFEFYKLAFLLPENAMLTGEVHILPIGLSPEYISNTPTRYHLTDSTIIKTIYRPRTPFANKGTYGHALLIAGSYGKIGAAVLSAKSCLRSGVGLLSCYVPQCGYDIMQISEPCAMCIVDENTHYNTHFHQGMESARYKAIGIGPGLDTQTATAKSLERLLAVWKSPMVIDADALNLLSIYPSLLQEVPKNSILTPHPKEFERLFGSSQNDIDRLELLSREAVSRHLYILLKGRYTAMACPDGSIYFNPTGNPGMATGGSGDVLTGILTGLLAQGYSSKEALLFGVWIHGYAGDLAAAEHSQEAMTAADIINGLGKAFQEGI